MCLSSLVKTIPKKIAGLFQAIEGSFFPVLHTDYLISSRLFSVRAEQTGLIVGNTL